ncbi:hypothetical protein, partial [Pseudomonas savastanoi]|uniref:hypothetical protein n=1 Tax=Pseudomonas savastanoi TaxID=29438 RepID=UPI001C803D70
KFLTVSSFLSALVTDHAGRSPKKQRPSTALLFSYISVGVNRSRSLLNSRVIFRKIIEIIKSAYVSSHT